MQVVLARVVRVQAVEEEAAAALVNQPFLSSLYDALMNGDDLQNGRPAYGNVGAGFIPARLRQRPKNRTTSSPTTLFEFDAVIASPPLPGVAISFL